MSINTAASLIAGYRSYAAAPDLAQAAETAPAASPAILSFIAYSSIACGSGLSIVGGSAVATTINAGC